MSKKLVISSLALAAHGKGVLIGKRDGKIGDVLAGLGHGIDSILFLHQRVDEALALRAAASEQSVGSGHQPAAPILIGVRAATSNLTLANLTIVDNEFDLENRVVEIP